MFLAQAQAPQLPPLPEGPALDRVRGPVAIPTFETWQIALAALFLLAVFGLLLWRLLRNRKKTADRLSPYATAVAELDAAKHYTDDDDARFAMLHSATLRRYLEDEHSLRFTARTSQEFLRSLKGNTHFDSAFQAKLGEVLDAFDQIKFARSSVSPETRANISATVRELIDQAHAIARQEDREA